MSSLVGYSSLSKAGRANEDRYRLLGGGFVLPDNRETAFKDTQRGELYAVMDGVGGASHGMAAAQYIADQLPRFFTHASSANIEALSILLASINYDVFGWGLMEGTQRPRGASTATLLWLSPQQQAHVCHVGDSSAFLLRGDRLISASSEHVEQGSICRYVGQGEGFNPELRHYPIMVDDIWCLVTDGVTKGLHPHQIKQILQDYAGEPHLAAKELVLAAKRKKVQDDITALVIEVEQ